MAGASTSTGRELAQKLAEQRFDLFMVARGPEIDMAASELRSQGIHVDAHHIGLACEEGVSLLQDSGQISPVPVPEPGV